MCLCEVLLTNFCIVILGRMEKLSFSLYRSYYINAIQYDERMRYSLLFFEWCAE